MWCFRSLTVLVIDLELWARELALTYSALAAGHATRDSAIDISAFPGPHRRAKQRRLSNSCPMNLLKWRLAKVELNFGKKSDCTLKVHNPFLNINKAFAVPLVTKNETLTAPTMTKPVKANRHRPRHL